MIRRLGGGSTKVGPGGWDTPFLGAPTQCVFLQSPFLSRRGSRGLDHFSQTLCPSELTPYPEPNLYSRPLETEQSKHRALNPDGTVAICSSSLGLQRGNGPPKVTQGVSDSQRGPLYPTEGVPSSNCPTPTSLAPADVSTGRVGNNTLCSLSPLGAMTLSAEDPSPDL